MADWTGYPERRLAKRRAVDPPPPEPVERRIAERRQSVTLTPYTLDSDPLERTRVGVRRKDDQVLMTLAAKRRSSGNVQIPGQELPGNPVTTVNARVHRFDGGTGSVLVSSGFPLTPGLLTSADLANVRVLVENVEQAVSVTALKGTFPDGSLRSILIQFQSSLGPTDALAAEVRFGQPRTTQDISPTTVTRANILSHGRLLPFSAQYLCDTEITLQPLQPAANDDAATTAFDTTLHDAWIADIDLVPFRGTTLSAQLTAGATSMALTNGYYYTTAGDAAVAGVRVCIGTWLGDYEEVTLGTTASGNTVTITAPTRTWPAGTAVNQIPFKASRNNGLFGNSTYDPYRGLAAKWCRTANSWYLGHAVDAFVQATQGYYTPSQGTYPTVNTEGFTVYNEYGAFAEHHGLISLSHATMYWLTGWEQIWRNLNFQRNRCGTGITSQAVANTLSSGWIHANNGIRYNVGRMWTFSVGYLLECTKNIGGTFGPGRVPTYATELTWLIDALETHQFNTADDRNDVVGISPTNNDSSWNSTGSGGFAMFQLAAINEFLITYYRYVDADARIPAMVQANLDCIINQSAAMQSGDTYYYPGVYCTPYEVSASEPPARGTPFSFNMHRSHALWLYGQTGTATYLTWADRMDNPDNQRFTTYNGKEYGELWGVSQAAGAYRAGATPRPSWAPTSITEPPAH